MKGLNKGYRIAILVAVWTGMCCAQVLGAGVTLAWDPNTEPDLVGYKVYYGTASGSYNAQVVLGIQTTYDLPLTAAGTYYIAVTAFNTSGQESGFSNEVIATVSTTTTSTVPTIVTTTTTPTTTTTLRAPEFGSRVYLPVVIR